MKQRSTAVEARRRNRVNRALEEREDASTLTFSALVQTITRTHSHFAARASLAVNVGLTLRNWTVGCHIQEFEQRGEERAKYGAGLFENLSASLRRSKNIKYHPRELRRCRQFYNAYPQIWGSLTPESRELLVFSLPQLVQPPSAAPLGVPADRLLTALSFSHFLVLLEIDLDPQLFVSRYQLELPGKDELERFLAAQVSSLDMDVPSTSRRATN